MNSFCVANMGVKMILGGISLKSILVNYKNEQSGAFRPTLCAHLSLPRY